MKNDLGLLLLRLTQGGLFAGHGSQKLFGWFGGYGLKGTAGWVESLGLRPGSWWAPAAAISEFSGGVLNALGLFHPLGPISIIASMSMATAKVHWGKPIWVTAGGAELPVTNITIALALMLTGPGRCSLDYALGIRVPRPLVIVMAAAAATLLALGIMSRPAPAPAVQEEPAEAKVG